MCAFADDADVLPVTEETVSVSDNINEAGEETISENEAEVVLSEVSEIENDLTEDSQANDDTVAGSEETVSADSAGDPAAEEPAADNAAAEDLSDDNAAAEDLSDDSTSAEEENADRAGEAFAAVDTGRGAPATPYLEVVKVDADAGTAVLNEYNAGQISGASSIQVAVWSKNDQSDIKWYNMTAAAGGIYTAEFTKKNHNNNFGTYYAHAYAFKSVGSPVFAGGVTFTVNDPAAVSGNAPSLELSNLSAYLGTGTFKVSNVPSNDSVSEVRIAVWSKDDQNDLKWYNTSLNLNGVYTASFSKTNHKNNIGKYYAHAYAYRADGSVYFLDGLTFELIAAETTTPYMEITDFVPGNGTGVFNVYNTAANSNISSVSIAVWSKDDQKDLKWYDTSLGSDGIRSAEFSKKNHNNNYGEFYAHAYAYRPDGSAYYLAGIAFTVEAPNANNAVPYLEIVQLDADHGTGTLNICNVPSSSGISSVKTAVWSKSDQSDMVWYDMVRNSSGVYTASFSKANHKYSYGAYFAHAYAHKTDGSEYFLSGIKFDVNPPADPEMAVTVNGSQCRISVSDVPDQENVSTVRYALWSKNDGQDDLEWLTANYDKAKAASYLDADLSGHKDGGTYYVHAYAYTSTGAASFVAGASFNLTKTGQMSCGELTAEVDTSAGSFTITAPDVYYPGNIGSVRAAVWSRSDMSDLVWYDAAKNDSAYSVSSDISKHSYNTGTYNAHFYIINSDGKDVYLDGISFDITGSVKDFNIERSSDEAVYTASVYGAALPGGINSVSFGVWSEENGQDDLKWYTASGSNGNYTGAIDIRNHKTAGKYYVHVYAVSRSNTSVFLTAGEFEVNASVRASIGISDADTFGGHFGAVVTIAEASGPVAGVRIKAWCADDGSDVGYYTATENNGVYTTNVNIANHLGNRGNYKLSAEVTLANGIVLPAASTTYSFSPTSYITLGLSDGSAKRKITYTDSSINECSFIVWTERGGIDDKTEYAGQSDQNGTFAAEVDLNDFTYDGKFFVHVYSGDTFLDGASFLMFDYVEDGVQMTSNESIGYSQYRRMLNPDVDCSSFVYFTLYHTGYLPAMSNAFTTYTQPNYLKSAGFTEYQFTGISDLQPGDILLRDGHTEIYYGYGKTMGAHQDENGGIAGTTPGDQGDKEVSIVPMSTNWKTYYRLRSYSL